MKLGMMILVCVCCCWQSVFGQGIRFESGSYEEALKKAKSERKLIFMDCYTTWCGPCKVMAEKVFTDPEAGEYFNSRFVNVKMDMEKGEGKELAKQFDIRAYPTLLLIQEDGTVLYKIAGSCSVQTLIERIQEGQDEENSIILLHKKYEAGKMSAREVVQYIRALSEAGEGDDARVVAEKLLGNLSAEEKVKSEYWPLFADRSITTLDAKSYQFLLAHKELFEKNVGVETVDQVIYLVNARVLSLFCMGNFLGNPEYKGELVARIKNQLDGIELGSKKLLLAECAFAEARNRVDVKAMMEVMPVILPLVAEDDLWGWATAFSKAEELGKAVAYKTEMKSLGELFVRTARAEEVKEYLRKYFAKYN